MDSNLQNSIDLSQQSGRVCITNLQRRDNSIPASEQYTVDLTHRTDQMCLDKMQHTHGSFMTAGSGAYTLLKKIEKMFDDLKTWLTTKFSDLTTALNIETISQAEVQNMWSDTPTPPTGGVTLVDGYLVGATIDNDGYLLATGFEIDNNNYIKLN